MRHFLLAFALIFVAPLPLCAFEQEAERIWGDPHATDLVNVLSTTDIEIAAPLIDRFLAARPDMSVRYVMATSREVYRAIAEEAVPFDLVMSSAMDLQMKLANDGLAAPVTSALVGRLPDWARWRDRLFGFTLEPVVLLVSRAGLAGLPVPRSRRALLDLIRENPDRFDGRIGTYDPRASGVGYLFATQDARQTDTFWRMAEVMGRLNTRLYCCSVDMIDDLEAGHLTIAYNVVGSYATSRLASQDAILIIEPEDYTIALLRTALVPVTSARPDLGAALLDFLLEPASQAMMGPVGALEAGARPALRPHMRPIRLDTGLLVHLDKTKRAAFLREWDGAMVQP